MNGSRQLDWQAWQRMLHVAEIDARDGRYVSYIDKGAGSGDANSGAAGAGTTGTPVVLLHGIPTWSYLWHTLVAPLAGRRRVLAPDLVGFGYSDKRDTFDRSIVRQAEIIDAWLGTLGIERAHIVGHDIGGGVALRLAAFYPHRVARLCVMNTIAYDSFPVEAMLQLGHPQAARAASAATFVATLKQAIKAGFATSPPDALLDDLLAPYTTEVGRRSLVRAASALNTNLTTEITTLLARLSAPTLILWGEDDPLQPVRYGERLAWDIPDARLARIKDASHFVMLDQPGEVLGYLSAFLDAN